MLHRTVAVLIVLFWLTMTTLLFRSEFLPGDSRLREIPISHVLKLFFVHEQASDLNIHYESNAIGRLRLHPQVRKEDGMRRLDFAGNMQVAVPGLSRDRVSWDGSVEVTRSLEMRTVRAGLNFRTPANCRFEVEHDVVARQGRYILREGEQVVMSRDYALGQDGMSGLLKQFEVPAEVVALVQSMLQSAGPAQPVEVSARQSSLSLQGEQIDTCRVTFRQNGQTLGEVHVSQLGHVLRATTILGYTFTPDRVQP